jgi:hypothetical protein
MYLEACIAGDSEIEILAAWHPTKVRKCKPKKEKERACLN